MSVTDQDQLELWLDGELTDADVNALRSQLSHDPRLSQALESLRSDRQVRQVCWSAMTPTSAEVDRLVSQVRSSMLREQLRGDRSRQWRNIASIAASVALVFSAGFITRGRVGGSMASLGLGTGSHTVAVNTVATNTRDNRPSASVAGSAPALATTSYPTLSPFYAPPSQSADLVSADPLNSIASGSFYSNAGVDRNGFSTVRPLYRLMLVDPMGTPIAVQPLENLNDPTKLSAQFSDFEARLLSNAGDSKSGDGARHASGRPF